MSAHSFKNLTVWQKSMDLVVLTYALARQLPDIEKFSLADQIRRCSVSIPSNIAESQKRATNPELKRYCLIALGSTAELETQLFIIDRNYYLDITEELALCQEVSRMLYGLIKSLS